MLSGPFNAEQIITYTWIGYIIVYTTTQWTVRIHSILKANLDMCEILYLFSTHHTMLIPRPV